MRTVIGIDVGGSTTKIVGTRKHENGKLQIIEPQFVRATDAVTSAYGAFGKFTMQNGIELSDINQVLMTGVGSSFIEKPLYSLPCKKVSEFTSVGRGGLYLSGLDEAVIVSMGTGTAYIHAYRDGDKTVTDYLGGTGVGGGTLLGLSKKMIGIDNIDHLEELAENGDLSKVDLRIKDMTASGAEPVMNADMTAANFGNVSDVATKQDIAKGIANLVYETVGMVSIFASRSVGVTDIVLTGNLTRLDSCAAKFEEFNHLGYGVRFTIPELAEFSTAIGCAISAFNLDNIH